MKFLWGSYDEYGFLVYTNDAKFKCFKGHFTLVVDNEEEYSVEGFQTFDQLASHVNERYKVAVKTPADLDTFINAHPDLYMAYVEAQIVK